MKIKRFQEFKDFALYEIDNQSLEKLPKIETWDDVKEYEVAALEKIRHAINFIISKHPVYSIPILEFGVHLHWDLPSKTAATDFSNIYFDPRFALMLTNEELRFVLLHECLHVLLLHNNRLNDRNHEKWNEATDYAINDMLVLDPLEKKIR